MSNELANTTDLESRAVRLLDEARAIQVADNEDYERAAEFLRSCKQMEVRVKDFMGPLVKKAHEAHKALTSRLNELTKPITEAARIVGRTMGDYQAECERQRRLEAEMVRAQQQAAADAAAEELAVSLATHGDVESAEAVIAHKPVIETPVIDSFAPKVAGTAVRTNWSFEITDAAAVPREYCIPDEKTIGALVRARKGQVSIPGVRVFSETVTHARV